MRIFVSYSFSDADLARTLTDVIDGTINRYQESSEIYGFGTSNLSSDIWPHKIREALRLADAMVVLWTERSSKSPGQLVEVGVAWFREMDIHVVLCGTSAQSLPSPFLAERHATGWLDFPAAFDRYVRDYFDKKRSAAE